jgi:hypothetical protein
VAIATINPATGETVKTYDEMSEADVERRLTAAATAYEGYRLTSFAERAEWMREAATILDAEQDQIAAMMTTEMGKTLTAARQEVAKCATACRYYAEHAAGFLADEPADADAVRRRYWPGSPRRCACTPRRYSARWPPCIGSPTWTRRSSSPTVRSSGSAPTRGPMTRPNRTGLSATSPPEWSSSTAT